MSWIVSGRVVREHSNIGVSNLVVALFDIDISPQEAQDLASEVRAIRSGSQQPLGSLLQRIFSRRTDKEDPQLQGDAPSGDRLGSVLTDSFGYFEIEYETIDFSGANKEKAPDLLLAVFGPDRSIDVNGNGFGLPEFQRLVHLSLYPRWNSGKKEAFFIQLPESLFEKAGVLGEEVSTETPESLKAELVAHLQNVDEKTQVYKDVYQNKVRAEISRKKRRQNQVSKLLADHSSQLLDTPNLIRATLPPAEKKQAIADAKIFAQKEGLDRLSSFAPKNLGLNLPHSALFKHFPNIDWSNLETEEIDSETLCGLVRTMTGMVRTKDIRDFLNQEEEPGGPSEPTPDPDERDEGGQTVQERLQKIIEDQIADLGQPASRELPQSTLERIKVDLEKAELHSGPADTTAFHDFHSLQIAFQDVWQEALDLKTVELASELYDEVVKTSAYLNDADDEAMGVDPILEEELESLEDLLQGAKRADSIQISQSPRAPSRAVRAVLPTIDRYWSKLSPQHRRQLSDMCRRAPGVGILQNFGTSSEEFVRFQARVQEVLDEMLKEIDSSGATGSRLKRLMTDLSQALQENYRFEYFAEDSINYGLLTTYRQTWKPGTYQAGDLVSTAPLAPGETRKFEVKQKVKQSREQTEIEKHSMQSSREQSLTQRLEQDVLRKAESATNFSSSTQGTFNLAIGSISNTTAFGANQSELSSSTKKEFRESIVKAAQEVRAERSIEVQLKESFEKTSTQSGELKNPNNELTVTYLMYELERQYRVSEKLHGVRPVVLVAQKMPDPQDCNEAFLLRNDWILRRVLPDASFTRALDALRESFVGDEVALGIKRSNWETQLQIVRSLEAEEQKWLLKKRGLQEQLVQAQYRQGLLEAQDDAGGLIKKLTDAIVYDPEEAGIGIVQAKIDEAESLLEFTEEEFQRTAERLSAARDALDKSSQAYSDAVQKNTQRRAEIDRLKIHVKDNILYYMQAIWAHEPSDQRYFRLYNKPAFNPKSSVRRCRVRRRTPSDPADVLPGTPLPEFIVEGCEAPEWTRDPEERERQTQPLHEVADLDRPLGFKGNYMIFPLKDCNLITDYMAADYVDSYFGVRDPDRFSEFTTEELQQYALSSTLSEEERSQVLQIVTERLNSAHRDEEHLVLPTGQLFIEALVGTHTVMEPFKLAHRGYDAVLAREQIRGKSLENLRYAARLLQEEPILTDPEIDKLIHIEGIDTQPLVPTES